MKYAKYALMLSLLAALLGGCAIVPAGYGDRRDGYSQERDYRHHDGYGRDYEYRGQYNNPADPFEQHGR